jgi:hypothetical protein
VGRLLPTSGDWEFSAEVTNLFPKYERRFSEEESMDSSSNQLTSDCLWRLTPDQRQQIYEEEKRRIKESGPVLSTRTKVLCGVYLFGCLLLYFGVPQLFIEFYGTHQWIYEPETDILASLVNAAVELIRPFLAVVICGWAVAIPVGVIWGFLLWGNDLLQFLRKLIDR